MSVVQLAETDRYSAEAEEAFAVLDARVGEIFEEIVAWRGWRLVTDRSADPHAFRAVVREIFRAVHMYQRHTTEAGFRMIGRLPKGEVKLLQVVSHHKAEEAEHGLWALEDFVTLGGDRRQALGEPPSPATFAVAAVWWRMADVEDPFGYFGAEYLFENLTLRVATAFLEKLHQRGLSTSGLRFIVEHATEDEKHSNLFRHLIKDTVSRFPDTVPAMLRCFDYFRAVYPLPVWDEAYERALG